MYIARSLLSLLLAVVICSFSVQAVANQDASLAWAVDRCTAIAVGRGATKEGYTMTTHTADCAECDWRINKVAARDWPAGSMRPIYLITGAYPRQVRDDRGETWLPSNLENLSQRPQWEKMRGEIIGYIPQVPHTYALIEGMYGIMNEHQVAIGESTCAAKLWAAPMGANGGKALLEASELSQIALERGKTAREVIQIMGDLAVKYGFYSADWDTSRFGPAHAMGEGGEGLTVIDKHEAWVFHILPDDSGSSAVWIAQRVPDNHVAAIANQFVIRKVKKGHPDFMYSDNIYEVAKRMGWWCEDQGELDFLTTYAPERYHPNYSNMRVWRVFQLANPDLKLPSRTDSYANDYPFSVEVPKDHLLSVEDVMQMNRDHYEGTEFSTAEGLAAGPYGDPNRYDVWSWGNMSVWDAMEGEFPRTISLFRTSYSFVALGRPQKADILSMLWFSQYAPDMSSYTPLYVNSATLPKPWIRGTMHKYDPESAWWNFCVVGNYVARFYVFAVKTVRELQSTLYAQSIDGMSSLESQVEASIARGVGDVQDIIAQLTGFTLSQGVHISNAWRDIFPVILTKYRDGYVMKNLDQPTIAFDRMFYPEWWLRTVGYFKIGGNKNGILFASDPLAGSRGSWGSMMSVFLGGMVLGVISLLSVQKYSQNSGSAVNKGRYVVVEQSMELADHKLFKTAETSNQMQGMEEQRFQYQSL